MEHPKYIHCMVTLFIAKKLCTIAAVQDHPCTKFIFGENFLFYTTQIEFCSPFQCILFSKLARLSIAHTSLILLLMLEWNICFYSLQLRTIHERCQHPIDAATLKGDEWDKLVDLFINKMCLPIFSNSICPSNPK